MRWNDAALDFFICFTAEEAFQAERVWYVAMKKIAINFIWTCLFSLPIFCTLDIYTAVYLIMAAFIWLLLILYYPVSKNRKLYTQVNPVFFGNLLMFVLAKYICGYRLLFDLEDIFCIIYGLILAWGCAVICRRGKRTEKAENDTKEMNDTKEIQESLFRERKFDKERLQEYLMKFPIVGINGAWGSGKSFVTDRIENNGCLLVKIDLLACNVDEIQTVLLNELDKVLKEQGIFSPFSPKLKKLLQQDRMLQNLGQLFVRDDISYSDAIKGFRDSFRQIKQTLIIVYEDLDRIEKPEVIKRVMGISEKIAGEKIKVLYQYDEKNLQAKGFDRAYLEKYIPFTMNLTDIPFAEILDYLFAQEKNRGLSVTRKDFEFLCFPIAIPFSISKGIGASISLVLPDLTIRKTEHFLDEIDCFLKKGGAYGENKREVILFFLLKHFYNEIYQALIPGQSLLEVFLFRHEEREDTMINWVRYCKMNGGDAADIFLAEENQVSALMVSLFQYECDIMEVERGLEAIVNEPVSNIRKENANEQKDRIVWNLLCSGRSELTDSRRMVERLYQEVLDKPRELQPENFEKLCNDVYHGRYGETEKGDNCTIFRIGVPSMISLFQANRVAGRTGEQWIAFVDFYLRYEKVEAIGPELIECLNYCELSDRKLYLFILGKFNQLKIVRNLNSHKAYKTFLNVYLSAFSSLGFADTEEVWALRNNDQEKIDVKTVENYVLSALRRKLEDLKKNIPIEGIRKDIEILLAFLEKNRELMHAEKEFAKPERTVKTSISSRTKNWKAVEQLNQSEDEEEVFRSHVQRLYEEGRLTAYEAARLDRFKD